MKKGNLTIAKQFSASRMTERCIVVQAKKAVIDRVNEAMKLNDT